MASLTRGPPPLLKPERTHSGLNAHTTHTHTSHTGHNGNIGSGGGIAPQRAIPRDTEVLPPTAPKNRLVGDTPLNTPAQPVIAIAPRLGLGGGRGRPIGRGGHTPHAITPGNTPSSLETMGRRIAGKLQSPGAGSGGGGCGGNGSSGGARIAPSYERRFTAGLTDLSHRLATHQETTPTVESPSGSMQRLQIVSPTSTEQGKGAEWPTSFDTDTNDGEASQDKGK